MNEKVKKFFNDLLIDEQEDQSDGKFGHYPFSGEVTTQEDKKEVIAFAGVNTEIMLSVFADKLIKKSKEILMSIDFPNCGDVKNDFVAVFSYIDEKIGIDIFPHDSNTGERLGHINSGVTHDNLCKMVGHYIGKSV